MNRVARARAARRAVSRDTALVHRLAALVLEDPTAELVELLPQLREAAGELSGDAARSFAPLLDHLGSRALVDV